VSTTLRKALGDDPSAAAVENTATAPTLTSVIDPKMAIPRGDIAATRVLRLFDAERMSFPLTG
jgi:hypothetical protein